MTNRTISVLAGGLVLAVATLLIAAVSIYLVMLVGLPTAETALVALVVWLIVAGQIIRLVARDLRDSE